MAIYSSPSFAANPNISKENENLAIVLILVGTGLLFFYLLYHCYRESKEPGEEVTVDHPYWHENSMRTPRQPKQSTPSPSSDQVLFQREDIVEHRHQLLHQNHSIPNHPVSISQFRINQNCSQQLLATPLHFRVQVPIHSPSTSTSTSTHSLIHSPSIAPANQQNAQSLRLLRASETRELSASKKTEHCSICMDHIEPLFRHTTAHHSPTHHILSTRVSIREFLENFEFVVETKQCKHIFHERCLRRWLTEGNSDCPLCRSPVQSNEFHRRELIYAIFG